MAEGKDQGVTVTVLPARAARGVKRPVISKGQGAFVEHGMARRSVGPSERPWAATGLIDVEALVTWALRDQRADRQMRAGLHQIEAEVLGFEVSGRSSDGCAAIADIHHMGGRIDFGGAKVRELIHPAAELVGQLSTEIQGGELVRHYGRLGVRPDGWQAPARWYRPVVWVKEGELGQWEFDDASGKRRNRLTRVIPTVTRAELERRRVAYAEWWEALRCMAWRLSARALGFAVTGPTAPRAPWLDVEAGA